MDGTYPEENGYLIPDLTLLTEEEKPIRIWGQRHLRYIKVHKRLFYANLLMSGRLNSYLADIDKQAENMFFRLVKQMSEREGMTERIKAKKQTGGLLI